MRHYVVLITQKLSNFGRLARASLHFLMQGTVPLRGLVHRVTKMFSAFCDGREIPFEGTAPLSGERLQDQGLVAAAPLHLDGAGGRAPHMAKRGHLLRFPKPVHGVQPLYK